MWAFVAMLAVLAGRPAAQTGDAGYTSFGGGGVERSAVPLIDTFEVTDADVRSVFKMLSKHSGVDIVLSEAVSGAVTLRLTDKSWQDIFMVVCRILKLEPVKEQNYFYVMTKDEFEAQLKADAAAGDAADRTAPLERHIITLSNTSANEMMTPVSTLLSARGKLTVVEHNNSLIVFDTKENIKQIRALVEKLDIETAQISISCKIIEVNSGESQNLGVHWGMMNPRISVAASHLQAPDPASGVEVVAGALEKISYGVLTPERFTVALEYLFDENRGEMVAQPSITTLDNKEARVFTGQQVPIVTQDIAGNSIVSMVNAGTELTVTPHVTGEGRIMLSLQPKKKSYTLTSKEQPIINEQSAQTSVVVNDGETVVIAGLTSNEMQNSEAGIPFLKDIPLIGHVFKRSAKSRANKDLIIFVTPHVIERQVSAAAPAAESTPQP